MILEKLTTRIRVERSTLSHVAMVIDNGGVRDYSFRKIGRRKNEFIFVTGKDE
jgi:hypothetical protein